jgi:hypothetical protein
LVSNTRRIALGSLFAVIIFLFRGFIPSPTADYLIGIEAFLVALGSVIVGRWGGTYIELVNGLIETIAKPSFAPFSLLLAILFGVQVDVLSRLLRVKDGSTVRTGRMVAVMTISTGVTGTVSYYTTVIVTNILPDQLAIAITILVFGVASGAAGGYFASRVWNRNLKARFQSQSSPS